jgi:uncharacterized membrane protein YeiB
MNIPGFFMPDDFSESFKSDPTNVNFWVSAVISVVFEGKMRALFGMIFGTGVLLFISKEEQAGRSVTRLFYRRMVWLILFGLIHAHLILRIGDTLYFYGFCGAHRMGPLDRSLPADDARHGYVSAVILFYKSRHARALFRRLEGVGQMALTNDIMQSVICTLVFFGYGLNYFAELEIYFVVLTIWVVQLAASPPWLRFFYFGPLEWVWRSLTHWKWQPFLRRG